jgi:hypothetical protein
LQFVDEVVGLLQRGAVVAGWGGANCMGNENHSQQYVFKSVNPDRKALMFQA